jgi:glycosyltransferase involved in cell wall biosynthesis
MRYAWHMREAYFGGMQARGAKARALGAFLQAMRDWDRRTAARVTHFIAISKTIQQRIAECYQRPSKVIYPPVDTDFYCPAPVPRENYYLAVSAFAPYKRLDLAVGACNRLKRRLLVIGTGQDQNRLHSLAGPTIQFLGWQPDDIIREHFRRCRALLFPGEEDFGIVPVEAQACGAPVIAFGRGGATETVIPLTAQRQPTGLWFDEQNVECLIDAIEQFELRQEDFLPSASRRQAVRFHQQRFVDELFAYLDDIIYPPGQLKKQAA